MAQKLLLHSEQRNFQYHYLYLPKVMSQNPMILHQQQQCAFGNNYQYFRNGKLSIKLWHSNVIASLVGVLVIWSTFYLIRALLSFLKKVGKRATENNNSIYRFGSGNAGNTSAICRRQEGRHKQKLKCKFSLSLAREREGAYLRSLAALSCRIRSRKTRSESV